MFLRRLSLCVALSFGAAPASAQEVVVFAAASMKGALDRVAADFQTRTGNEVLISYAGSNALAKQILQGAPADLFIAASEDWMDQVEAAGLVVPGQRRVLAANRLVLVAHDPAEGALDLAEKGAFSARLAGGKLAMGMVDSVPAGQYGKAALDHLGLWDAVRADVVESENVRASLALVAMGEAGHGIVYATDAKAEPGVTVIATFPEDSHPPITYPAALLTGAADQADRDFLQNLWSPEARAVFAAQGFTPAG